MSNHIRVEAYRDESALPPTLRAEIKALAETIQERAFRLFQSRGGGNGGELDDWLRAEREVVWSPALELTENDRDFHARIALPGFNEKDLKVTAAPGELIVEAEKTHTHKGKSGGILLCEFSDKQLFRRLEMPAPINVDKVTAKLDRGILFIHAPKAAQPKQAKSAAAR
jgi:HSP20 family protein